MDSYKVFTVDDAINALQKIKEEHGNLRFMLTQGAWFRSCYIPKINVTDYDKYSDGDWGGNIKQFVEIHY